MVPTHDYFVSPISPINPITTIIIRLGRRKDNKRENINNKARNRGNVGHYENKACTNHFENKVTINFYQHFLTLQKKKIE